jgi:uncharacterized RDD family membrane protein YckC
MGAPPGWYLDPDGSGHLRYFDGQDWTEHRAPSTPPAQWSPPPWPPSYATPPAGSYPGGGAWGPVAWKGAQLGRPAQGPGALASQGRRLGARALDGLVLLPVVAVAVVIGVALAWDHAAPAIRASQDQDQGQNAPVPVHALLWIYGTFFAIIIVVGLVQVAYETVATARYGRTLGKMWLHIRPIRTDGQPVGWARSFVRVLVYWIFSFLGWIGLIDTLWCLWDNNQQCLHDKVADTIVVYD